MIFEKMAAIVSCLCDQIIADGSPEPCFCGVLPGEAPVADYIYCDGDRCGMAYVRLAAVYPANTPAILLNEPGNCGAGIGYDLEVGIFRCFPLAEDGGPPDEDLLLAATMQQVKDAETMQRALYCCPALGAKDFVLGQYAPIGPDGQLLGGTWPVYAVL